MIVVEAEAFARDPAGKVVIQPGFAVWMNPVGLIGITLIGRVDREGVPTLHALGDACVRRAESPPRILLDARRLDTTAVDLEATTRAIDEVKNRVALLRERGARQAIVVPSESLGAVIAGVYAMARAEHAWRWFRDLTPALAFLECGGDCEAKVEQLTADIAAPRDPVARIHAAVMAGAATLDDVARALGVSRRTLQRQLEALGTSLRAEVRKVRR